MVGVASSPKVRFEVEDVVIIKNDLAEELFLRSLRASFLMSLYLTPVGGRKKNVYWKVSVGLKCVRMSRKTA